MAGVDDVEGSPERERRNGVQSIDRAVAILRCFDGRKPELGISELARSTGLSTSTVHRLLSAMQDQPPGAADREPSGTGWVRCCCSWPIPERCRALCREAALPFMTDLRDEFDETIGVHELLASGQRIVAAQVESHQELRRTYTDIGVPIRLVYGGPGKAILCCDA